MLFYGLLKTLTLTDIDFDSIAPAAWKQNKKFTFANNLNDELLLLINKGSYFIQIKKNIDGHYLKPSRSKSHNVQNKRIVNLFI